MQTAKSSKAVVTVISLKLPVWFLKNELIMKQLNVDKEHEWSIKIDAEGMLHCYDWITDKKVCLKHEHTSYVYPIHYNKWIQNKTCHL